MCPSSDGSSTQYRNTSSHGTRKQQPTRYTSDLGGGPLRSFQQPFPSDGRKKECFLRRNPTPHTSSCYSSFPQSPTDMLGGARRAASVTPRQSLSARRGHLPTIKLLEISAARPASVPLRLVCTAVSNPVPQTTATSRSLDQRRLLEPEALALGDGPLQEPGELLLVRVLRQHQHVEASVGGREVVRVRPGPLNLWQ